MISPQEHEDAKRRCVVYFGKEAEHIFYFGPWITNEPCLSVLNGRTCSLLVYGPKSVPDVELLATYSQLKSDLNMQDIGSLLLNEGWFPEPEIRDIPAVTWLPNYEGEKSFFSEFWIFAKRHHGSGKLLPFVAVFVNKDFGIACVEEEKIGLDAFQASFLDALTNPDLCDFNLA